MVNCAKYYAKVYQVLNDFFPESGMSDIILDMLDYGNEVNDLKKKNDDFQKLYDNIIMILPDKIGPIHYLIYMFDHNINNYDTVVEHSLNYYNDCDNEMNKLKIQKKHIIKAMRNVDVKSDLFYTLVDIYFNNSLFTGPYSDTESNN